jgi:hypothetical protein
MELAAENVLAGREHCFSEIGLLSFENRTLLVEDRENNGREPDDYPQGLSGAQLRADSRNTTLLRVFGKHSCDHRSE